MARSIEMWKLFRFLEEEAGAGASWAEQRRGEVGRASSQHTPSPILSISYRQFFYVEGAMQVVQVGNRMGFGANQRTAFKEPTDWLTDNRFIDLPVCNACKVRQGKPRQEGGVLMQITRWAAALVR